MHIFEGNLIAKAFSLQNQMFSMTDVGLTYNMVQRQQRSYLLET